MDKVETVKRYAFFLAGLFVNSLGVAFITKADLGTSPISSVPYVLSLGFPFTLGQFTVAFNLLIIALQVLILRKEFQLFQLMQLPVIFLFGYFIDFSMDHILFWMHPEVYFLKVVFLLAGCAILGFGVFMEVAANVLMLPGEALTNAIHLKSGKEFGLIKICVDSSMAGSAIIISLAIFGSIAGIREGTAVAAFLVGYLSRFFCRVMHPYTRTLFARREVVRRAAAIFDSHAA